MGHHRQKGPWSELPWLQLAFVLFQIEGIQGRRCHCTFNKGSGAVYQPHTSQTPAPALISMLFFQAKRKRQHMGDLKIVVAGCVASQEGGALLRRIPEVDLVMGPQHANRSPQTDSCPFRTGLASPFTIIDPIDCMAPCINFLYFGMALPSK